MADSALTENFILDEAAARKIISTIPTKLSKSDEFNDLYLDSEERITSASNVLESRNNCT